MHVNDLIQAIEAAVPAGAAPGTRHRVEGRVDTGAQAHEVAIAVRMDAAGRRRETWLCDGIRVERPLLLRLTCAQTDCPQAQQAQRDWQNFHRRRLGLPQSHEHAGGRLRALQARAERNACVMLEAGALTVQAIANRFQGYARCPNHAHPPICRDLPGYDVFDGFDFVVGGGTQVLRDGRVVDMGPRVRSLAQVQAWLDESHRQAGAAIDRAAAGARS
ncbi:hypothetical protein [Ideonella aquatica]|uniref:hypothetical protein n=1 Tax=Ideonella aquatica TaxID=2824119 RepID=UPI001B37F2EC|nr:hypothetical protein [Ideonella aquatica]